MTSSTDATTVRLETAVADAAAAAPLVRDAPRAERAGWLVALADALESDRAGLVAVARVETHLAAARLDGEVTRTANQLRFFAGVLAEGSYLEVTLDPADPSAVPPRPDLRRMLRPIGPVAVFAASNFPFAFSVLGNDTASALAAGCPVVVKAHPGHPELSRRTAALAVRALAGAGAPAGTFALVEGLAAGVELVRHPLVKAVGFTGSVRGGRALFDIAVARPEPIPFYGELGSVNPVVVTQAAAADGVDALAAGLVASFTRDGGQYCTKPGLVFVPAGTGFEDSVAAELADATAQPLLTDGIGQAYAVRSTGLAARGDAEVIWAGSGSGSGPGAAPVVIATSVDAFLAAADEFLEECFGPLTVLVRYRDRADLGRALAVLQGSLTGTIRHAAGEDVRSLAEALAPVAGRIVFNGWPTGVVIGWAQHHGGSWPATTASLHSSVGATAIRRFLAPIAYQDAPQAVLPAELRDGNPLRVPRREDGRLVVPAE
jgi:NADP-dependent aldehyde dehydrogenase